MADDVNKSKKLGRPKKETIVEDVAVNEVNQERLDMEEKEHYTIEEITKRWNNTFNSMAEVNGQTGASSVAEKWNKLNPFLQNQRLKNLYSNAKKYDKANIGEFLMNPANSEKELRSLSWSSSSSQQIYYNILRRSSDIPLYHYYKIPDLLDLDEYSSDKFNAEDKFVDRWLEKFGVQTTFKTMALEIKREGKSTYLLRNKFTGSGKNKQPVFCTLQKMPTDWIKITGKGQLGFTVSFDMMYFMNIANNPSDFGDFMEKAWEDIVNKGIVTKDSGTSKYTFDISKAAEYSFNYNNKEYATSIESVKRGKQNTYLFWLRMPYDICYTFGSDNSNPWVAPDTMGLMLKLQELTDYGQLAGLIASTPLTAVLTGEIETIQQPRAGKNESVYTPEVLRGYMDQFNQKTSTNVEAWLWPAKNIKLQQLASDVNSSEIISTATENFLTSSGENGLTIATEKPNVAQVVVAKQLAASQQHYVTLQFEQVLNFILQHKLDLDYHWKIKIWDDIFNHDNNVKSLKEIVANGNIALLPKLMSAEGLSMRDTKAFAQYIKSLDFYKEFMTYTQLRQAEISEEQAENENEDGTVGRPSIDDADVENDATAASKENGTNTTDNREQNK